MLGIISPVKLALELVLKIQNRSDTTMSLCYDKGRICGCLGTSLNYSIPCSHLDWTSLTALDAGMVSPLNNIWHLLVFCGKKDTENEKSWR